MNTIQGLLQSTQNMTDTLIPTKKQNKTKTTFNLEKWTSIHMSRYRK